MLTKQRKLMILNTPWAPPRRPQRPPSTLWNQENDHNDFLSTSQSSPKQPKRPPLALKEQQGVNETDEIDVMYETDEIDEIYTTEEIGDRDEIELDRWIDG